ncbi:calcium-binding protein PBP1-like [Senna tora]|uniref:Calcium-binding protein PBP1-like n=1 Tax=Senna tora TaxID=362788 RepID=A0A834SR57_9FABA|nr:calcium-binding protein PBP1-like [Senna tora]
MAGIGFEDLLPMMADKLGGEGLIKELCNGFELLMDKEKGVITLESLRTNSALLGLHELKEDELVMMMKEADLDGDGALTQMDFCVLMFRLSPDLINHCCFYLDQPLQDQLNHLVH